MQFENGKGFLGAEFMMILSKKMKYEYDMIISISISHLDEDTDVGATILGIFVGMNF